MDKKNHLLKKSVAWSIFWILLAFLFNVGVYFYAGKEKALEFLAGYLIEKSLSVDNIFVFFVIFSFFKIPTQYQKRVLFHGIAAALIFRFVLIFLGVEALKHFSFLIYILGIFLLLTGLYVIFKENTKINPETNFLIRWIYRKFNVTQNCEGESFFVKRAGVWFITPLFLSLFMIEVMDIMFALDSIPAIFGITTDIMIVYASNIFAILGLRSLYVVLTNYTQFIEFFKSGIGLVLSFIGLKILISPMYSISVGVSLGVIVSLLLVTFFCKKKLF